jgi:hypothetical protein
MAPPPLPGAVSYFAAIDGKQSGPMDQGAIQEAISQGKLTPTTLVWTRAWPSGPPRAKCRHERIAGERAPAAAAGLNESPGIREQQNNRDSNPIEFDGIKT